MTRKDITCSLLLKGRASDQLTCMGGLTRSGGDVLGSAVEQRYRDFGLVRGGPQD
jgi:hypothetical protein